METITIHNPKSIFPPYERYYSHGIEVPASSRILYLSGQVGVDGKGETPESDPVEQLIRAWKNINAVLSSAHMDKFNIVKINCYIADVGSYTDKHVEYYSESCKSHLLPASPAMTAVVVKRLWLPTWFYEIEAIAFSTNQKPS